MFIARTDLGFEYPDDRVCGEDGAGITDLQSELDGG